MREVTMIGSCLCGGVSWEIDGPLQFMTHCHCSRCRKVHGVGFATLVAGMASGFRLTGQENVVDFESSPGFSRSFCRRCGTSVPHGEWQGMVFVPVGSLDGDPEARPGAHIFVASKAPWVSISDGLPCFNAYPEGVGSPELPDVELLDPAGKPRGSCLCGGIGFVLESPALGSHHCHCRRCRKARAALFASNLFTAIDGVRFTRGQELLSSYKVPDAQFFTQVFCRVCGGKMPRINPERGFSVVPMGSLDDDPGIRPQSHIFVASKVPWYDIQDDLPQHAERAS